MDKYKVIGIMSGTSLDGLDIAFCKFKLEKGNWSYKINSTKTVKYTADLKKLLSRKTKVGSLKLVSADKQFGNFIANEVNKFIRKNKQKPDFISSHGHTIFHQPEKGLTFQIGSGRVIVDKTGLPVVCDFRTLDVALGGQGAPLVPIGDKLLFSEYDACLNLGGFANISFEKNNKRIAFDICPANIVLNHFAKKLGKEYDKNGMLALKGKLNTELLKTLNSLEFYSRKPPKSLGKEWVNQFFNPILNGNPKNILRTVCEHISTQVSETINTYLNNKKKKVLVTGGGAYNNFLIELIKEKSNAQIMIPDKNTIEFKEALIFAFLGVLRLRGEINTLRSVTGASKDSSGGVIYQP